MEKWVLFGGRLHRELVAAIQEYKKIEIESYEMVDSYRDVEVEGVKGVIILDAGLHSLRELGVINSLGEYFKGAPKLLYVRDLGVEVDEGSLGEGIQLKQGDNVIYINNIVQGIEEVERGER